MRSSLNDYRAAILAVLLLLLPTLVYAQNPFGGTSPKGKPTEEPPPEFSLTESDLDGLTGQTFDVVLKNGKTEAGLTLKEIQRHKQRKNEIRLVEMTQETPKKTRKFPPSQLLQLVAEGQQYQVLPLTKLKSFVLIDATKQNAAIQKVLETQGSQLWPRLTTEDREKYTAEDKTFLETMKTEFPDARWNLAETDDYLFLSELPPAQAGQVLRSVERTCEVMAKTLDVPSPNGVWRGKCPIVVFSSRTTYQRFAQLLPPNDFPGIAEPVSPSNQRQVSIRMYKDGRVIIGGFIENAPDLFATALVRSVARGFLHRYYSNVPMPFFIREGTADWVTGVVVPGNTPLKNMQQAAAKELKETGSMGATFVTSNMFEVWECGVAVGLVRMLVESDPTLFQKLITQLKQGKAFEETLLGVYGTSISNLYSGYGQTIGVPLR